MHCLPRRDSRSGTHHDQLPPRPGPTRDCESSTLLQAPCLARRPGVEPGDPNSYAARGCIGSRWGVPTGWSAQHSRTAAGWTRWGRCPHPPRSGGRHAGLRPRSSDQERPPAVALLPAVPPPGDWACPQGYHRAVQRKVRHDGSADHNIRRCSPYAPSRSLRWSQGLGVRMRLHLPVG